MLRLLPLCLAACGGPALRDLPPTDRAPLCRQLNAVPAGTFGCAADQLPALAAEGEARFSATLHFRADGRLARYADLAPVRAALADTPAPAPDCVVDELKSWQLTGLTGPVELPVTLTYTAGPTDFREAALEAAGCSVRITLESQ